MEKRADLTQKPTRRKNQTHSIMTEARPIVTGQCAQVLSLIREYGPILSLDLTATHAIPEAAARIHDLRRKGFNIRTEILPEVEFRGQTRKRIALYSIESPEWRAVDAF